LKLPMGHIQLCCRTLQICVECCSHSSKNVHSAVLEVSHGYQSVFSTTDSAGNKAEVCAFYTITESVADRPQCSSRNVIDCGNLWSKVCCTRMNHTTPLSTSLSRGHSDLNLCSIIFPHSRLHIMPGVVQRPHWVLYVL
jgi:hypothetical protein